MLPAPPKSFGRLGDVLISALACVQGRDNPLKLPQKNKVIVIIVDGLGCSNLSSAAGHAAYLNSLTSEKIHCFFPATTSTSLTSLTTGAKPWETGFLAYLQYDRQEGLSRNLLTGWPDYQSGADFQTIKTVSELAEEQGITFNVLSLPEYEESGLTGATLRGAIQRTSYSIESRFEYALDVLRQRDKSISYLYIPELDQIAHAYGINSNEWLAGVELVDAQIRNLSIALPRDSAIIVTADHGVIDIDYANHLYIDEHFSKEIFEYVGGDTRSLQLYLKDSNQAAEILERLQVVYSEYCYVVTPAELIEAGYWKESSKLKRFAPDILLLAKKRVALFHRDFARKKSLANIGHHGSITDEELAVPLIRIGF
jgi:predicted AlkP superfamily pyrophosphatase or phosphodiesterase